jgi:hypothetical protein
MTEQEKKESLGQVVCWGYFCGEPEKMIKDVK